MIYTLNGKQYDKLPDPCNGVTPMTEARFTQMGGTISEGPQEAFLAGLDAYLTELEKKAEALALDISKEQFKQAASSMMSSELVEWALNKGVPREMIQTVRSEILAFVADASRLGMTWSDIFPKQPSK